MPAFDVCHEQVVHALEKDGWQIVVEHEQYRYQHRSIYVDFRAERQENGSTQNILLAEVKCFTDEKAHTTDLYIAIGQYLMYQEMLDRLSVVTPSYLVIPASIYDTVFEEVARRLARRHGIKLITVNLAMEAIEQWID